MPQAVEDSIRPGGIGKPLRPGFDGELAGHGGRPRLVTARDPVKAGPTRREAEGRPALVVPPEQVEAWPRLDPAKPGAAWVGHQTIGQQSGQAVIPPAEMAPTSRGPQGAEHKGFSDPRGPGHPDRLMWPPHTPGAR
jgi:hypothetical protein